MGTIALVADPGLTHEERIGIHLAARSSVCLDLFVGGLDITQVSRIHAHGIGETGLKQPGIVATLDGDEHTQRHGKRHGRHPNCTSCMRGGCSFFRQRDLLLSGWLARPYEKAREQG